MRATLLGTGTAAGMPVPLCDCPYCRASERRRRPSLLVETADRTVVFDVGPDLRNQLRRTDTTAVDAFFLTHYHRDHADGMADLLQATRTGASGVVTDDGIGHFDGERDHTFDLYLTPTAVDHVRETFAYTLDTLTPTALDGSVTVGDLGVTPVPLDHWRPTYETVGFLIEGPTETGLYAPDMRGFDADPPSPALDWIVADGGPVVSDGRYGHAPPERLRSALAAVTAGRRVLVNASEHAARLHTDRLAANARAADCELGTDFQEV